MTTNERAAKIVLKWYRPRDVLYNLRIEDLVAYAMTTARREALEEAAALMGSGKFCRYVEHAQGLCTCEDRVAAIRALMDQEPQNGGRE